MEKETEMLLQDLIKRQAEASSQIKENDKRFAESREQQKKRDEELDKRFAKLGKFLDEVGERIDKINEIVNGTSESNGKFSETYFYNSLFNSMRFGGKDFDEIEKGMKRARKLPDGEKLRGEYDVVMYNGDTVALIEIKYKVRNKDIETLTGKQVNVFRQLFPQYAEHKFYLGIAGMSFEGDAEEEALKQGVGILRPSGENVEILDKDLKAY
ncbi:MAG: hypothetical protein LBH98_04455 [Chitinispirillales bacterium]|jgi:hypothetical protein|nr:hypothetical protein [Chitinispirillales bacterium]